MEAIAQPAVTARDSGQTMFWIKRLHSLSGVFPLTVFVSQHLLINSLAGVGPEAFNRAARALHYLPYLWALEIGIIFAPLTFHALVGIWLASRMHVTAARHSNTRNLLYVLQRITGGLAFAFILYHLYGTWLPIEASTEFDYHLYMADHLHSPIRKLIYLIGAASVVFHAANGLSTFLITWGITVSDRSQRAAGLLCAGFGGALMLLTLRAVFAF